MSITGRQKPEVSLSDLVMLSASARLTVSGCRKKVSKSRAATRRVPGASDLLSHVFAAYTHVAVPYLSRTHHVPMQWDLVGAVGA